MANTNLGRILIIHKGEYNVETNYSKLDVVNKDGNSYISVVNGNIGQDVSNTSYWKLMSEKGYNATINGYDVVLVAEGQNIEIEQNEGTLTINAVVPTKTSDLADDTNLAYKNANNNFSVSQTINGGLTVNGDITQYGTSYITHAEEVKSTNDNITLREGATGSLTGTQKSGFKIEKYDGTNTGIIGLTADGILRIGDEGDEQPVATRAEKNALTNGEIIVWDSANLKFVTGNRNDIVRSVKPLTGTSIDPEIIPGKVYTLGTVSSLNLAYPTTAVAGEEILVRFYSGSTATNITISANVVGTVTCLANTYYMILATFDSEKWVLNTLEY